MTQPITWLHLSDLHVGAPGRPLFWQVHEEFEADVRRLARKLGPPDLLLFTGDLAFSGAKQQYEQLDRFLDDLQRWLREEGAEEDPILLPVPGNHDLCWPQGRDALACAALESMATPDHPAAATLRQMFWEQRDVGLVAERFAEYLAWFERRVVPQWRARGVEFHRSIFPGDYRARVVCRGQQLHVVGLNSAWVQYRKGNDFRGKVHVSAEQFQAALAADDASGASPLALLPAGEPALLLQHHPLDWFAGKSREQFLSMIYSPHRFTACLYGHMHLARSEHQAIAGGAPRCWYQSPSLFGVEHYGESGEERAIGYTWGRLSAEDLRIWPRRRVARGDATCEFGHEAHFPEGEDGVLLREIRRPAAAGATRAAERSIDLARYRDYLVALRAETDFIPMQGFGSVEGAQQEAGRYPIEAIYTRLRARDEREHRDVQSSAGARLDVVGLGDVLARHERLLVVGQPGAGKSTFLRLAANLLARDLLGAEPPPDAASWRAKELGFREADSAPLPILIRIEALARSLAGARLPDDRERVLDQLDPKRFGLASSAPRSRWQADIEAGRALLLFDGLDEVADAALRQRLFQIFADAARAWRKTRMLVTSRPFQTDEVRALGFAVAEVEPFGDAEIASFIERWVRGFLGIPPGEPLTADAAARKAALDGAVRERPRLALLASNPVMLTCLCVIHWNEGELPDSRQRVYRAVLRWLLRAKERVRKAHGFTSSLAERSFSCLALMMLDAPKGKQASVALSEAAAAVDAVFQRDYPELDDAARRKQARAWLECECLASGIVQMAGGDRVRFWHLTFQELYAALELSRRGDAWERTQPHFEDPQWREAVDLLPGCLHERGVEAVDAWFERILAQRRGSGDLATDARVAGLVGRMLECLAGLDYAPAPAVRKVYRECLERALAVFTPDGAAKVALKDRIAAAEALGAAGDPRLQNRDANLLPVPGTGVRLGKYLVTVEEFKDFVEHGGYEEREQGCWDAEGWRFRVEGEWNAPAEWPAQLRTPNRPVVGVSWYEAAAYCRWRTKLHGGNIRLQRAAEWVAAAAPERGTYPWGEREPDAERANFGKSIGAPTPVGLYPLGAGRYGHLDLAGNVWEWCEDRDDGGLSKDLIQRHGPGHALRGGSWVVPAVNLAVSRRDGGRAASRSDDVGFRVVSVPASTVS